VDQFKQFKSEIVIRLIVFVLASSVISFGGYLLVASVLTLPIFVGVIIWALLVATCTIIGSRILAAQALQPLEFVWRAALHMDPSQSAVQAPDMTKLKMGHDIVGNLVTLIYQYAGQQDGEELAKHRQEIIQASNVVSRMPIPLFVFNKEQVVTNASDTALEYAGITSAQLFGKPFYEAINLEFPTERTLENWVIECQNKLNDLAYWQRVRFVLPEGDIKLCDVAAEFKKDSPSGAEYIVTVFDRTEHYTKDDQDLSFVALAVHELRTPLTMLRGYIEVFDDELTGKLDDELASFMEKMKVSASQLNIFFNNILNVARIEQNQLVLKLTEGTWQDILSRTVSDLEMRAKVHNRTIQLHIAPDLPTVGVDGVSIVEVINNLVDNAIKYSPEGGVIAINSQLDKSGMVETLVQDTGAGIPSSVMPHLFSKFYRSHRSARSVGGTGLGLYLCKAIVDAHGGQIWANSKEGQGSTFGFTLIPFANLAEELKKSDNEGITRGAHGWIKNHTLYRQ
jgi:signal transduction histidine kinase